MSVQRIKAKGKRKKAKGRELSLFPFAFFLLLFSLAGCGGPVDVQGKVTMNGKPLVGATVVFIPEGGGPEAGSANTPSEYSRLP